MSSTSTGSNNLHHHHNSQTTTAKAPPPQPPPQAAVPQTPNKSVNFGGQGMHFSITRSESIIVKLSILCPYSILKPTKFTSSFTLYLSFLKNMIGTLSKMTCTMTEESNR